MLQGHQTNKQQRTSHFPRVGRRGEGGGEERGEGGEEREEGRGRHNYLAM